MVITDSDERTGDNVDRISELPEHILHHILSLFRWRKDVARTCILSKKWKTVLESFTSFDFDQSRFNVRKTSNNWDHLVRPPVEEQSAMFKQVIEESSASGFANWPVIEKFILFVENTLATRLEPLPSMQKFRLCVFCCLGFLEPFMVRWITAAIDKKVKELEIHVDMCSRYYILPQFIFASETITSLKLYNCKVDASASIKMQNLRQISMKAMHINVNTFNDLVQGCPLIEEIRVIRCFGLRFLHISTLPKLNRLEVHEAATLKSIKLEAPNLETFWFHGRKSSRCKIILAGCRNVKNLKLKHEHMADKSFHELISYFPLLENTFLLECHALQRITILSDKLKTLSLLRCHKLNEVSIDAPNLLSFEYTGAELPLSSIKASRLLDVKLHLKFQKQKSFLPLAVVQKFIQGFDAIDFNLFLASKQDVNMYEDLRGIPPLPIGVFKIELTKSTRMLGTLLDRHLRDFRPKTLTVKAASPSSDVVVFIREMLMDREKTPSCCEYYSKKCWRHYLEDVIDVSNASSSLDPSASFELKWRAP